VTEEPTAPFDVGPSVCPFLAFEDDRDHRSDSPDYRHRCFAAPEPEPRAFPHQERYCLSDDFARCPVFLDWARQEAAGVKLRGAETAATLGAAAAAALGEDGEPTPAFLASRPRPSSAEAASAADAGLSSRKATDATATLWTYEGENKRTAPSAPTPPSSLGAPAVAMARRGPSHPGWENPPRLESFPRLRSREDRRANQPLVFAAILIAVVMVALALFPILTSSKSGTPGASGSAGASGSGLQGAVQSATPKLSAEPTFFQYLVKSGDMMWTIANKFNILQADLIAANPQISDPSKLLAGYTVLNIPPPGWHASPTSQPTASPSPS
jgi:LysM repeat protein